MLDSIANGERPEKIKYKDKVYNWNKNVGNYILEYDKNVSINWDFVSMFDLDNEVEIIEDKINKDIKWYFIEEQEKEKTKIAQINMNFKILREKLTEIIDKLNEMEKE